MPRWHTRSSKGVRVFFFLFCYSSFIDWGWCLTPSESHSLVFCWTKAFLEAVGLPFTMDLSFIESKIKDWCMFCIVNLAGSRPCAKLIALFYFARTGFDKKHTQWSQIECFNSLYYKTQSHVVWMTILSWMILSNPNMNNVMKHNI